MLVDDTVHGHIQMRKYLHALSQHLLMDYDRVTLQHYDWA